MTGLWFAIQVIPRHEIKTATILGGKGYEYFVPLYQRRQRWSDRVKIIDTPLFQGYVFCRFDASVKSPIVTTPGVIRIVGTGRQPLPVDESEMRSLRTACDAGSDPQPHPFVQSGSRVVVVDGPLAGVRGVVADMRNRRIVLNIGTVQQSISIDLGRCRCMTIDPSPVTTLRCAEPVSDVATRALLTPEPPQPIQPAPRACTPNARKRRCECHNL